MRGYIQAVREHKPTVDFEPIARSGEVDWRYSNNVIGRKYGVTDQTVSVWRKKVGAPKSSIMHHNPPHLRDIH